MITRWKIWRKNSLVYGLLLLALAVRLYRLIFVPLNLDEIDTISQFVSLPVIEIFQSYHSNNHAMASALAHMFSPQADNLFLLRWPIILVGMLSLPFLYRLSTDLFGHRVGLLSLLLFSLSPVYMGYSVIVRGYSGFISLTVISLYFLQLALRHNRWRDWLAFLVTNLVVLHFHLFGAFVTWTQLGLAGLWLLWQFGRSKWALPPMLKQQLIRFGVVVMVLVTIQLPIIYLRTTLIVAERSRITLFDVWGNEKFLLSEELSPVAYLAGLMGPMSPGGIGTYLYLAFFVIGLIHLWRFRLELAVGVLLWLAIPFVAVFFGMEVIGATFYVRPRYILYLLPVFLILVAVGMVISAEWLLALAASSGRPWKFVLKGIVGISGAGLILLLVVSTHWYFLTATPINWWRMAQVLSQELQPEDITICEESHGFDQPDRAKAYCIWMLDFFTPELDEHSSNFQSSTDFVAKFDYLQRRRPELLEPGGVWLVTWNKVIFNPGQLVTDTKPATAAMPPSSVLAPYRVWNFGSASLIHIDSEPTLFENIYRTLELLVRIEPSPADRARYYRSLAEIEAFRGRKQQALEFFDKSWHTVEQIGGQYPDLFLLDTAPVIERIPESGSLPEDGVEIGYIIDSDLCLRGYQIEPTVLEAGRPLLLTLYWQVLDFVDKDYTFFLHLNNETGQTQGQFEFEPFDRTYPTPWWWTGQQLIEERNFIIPVDLPGQDYLVQFGASDRRSTDDEVLIPLFQMSYQSDLSTGWAVEPITGSGVDCP